MRWLKPFIFTILSVLLLLQAGGLIQLYKAERIVWHYKMLATGNGAQPVTVTLSAQAFIQNTHEGANEIALSGKMHDIVSTARTTNDSVIVTALPDAEEDEILDRISKAVHKSGRQLPAQLFKLFDLCYLPADLVRIQATYRDDERALYGYRDTWPIPHTTDIAYPPEYC